MASERKSKNEIALKPCPLCGSMAQIHESLRGGGYVVCSNIQCGCSTGFQSVLDAAVARWNRRSIDGE